MKTNQMFDGSPVQKSSRNLFFVILTVILLLIAAFLIIRPKGASAEAAKQPASQTQQKQ